MLWMGGEKARALTVRRACECGCDTRTLPAGTVGYITGSQANGTGVTIPIVDETEYQVLRAIFDQHGLR